MSAIGSSLGSEVSGRIIHALEDLKWDHVDIYHTLFWIYAVMGVINALLMLMLGEACELQSSEAYTQVPQDDAEVESSARQQPSSTQQSAAPTGNWFMRSLTWFSTSLSEISAPTRSIMYKLWTLLALDSIADGMVPYSLTNYYMDNKFHPAKSTLGDITSASYFLAAIGSTFAGPMARKIGLINTMVFTHVPSSMAVLFFPAPPYLWLTAALLLVRAGLNNMDQAPRSAFIAAVVKPQERTAVIGITAMVRTLAATFGPTVTGLLAARQEFWIAFVAAGICRLFYDFGLFALFKNIAVEEGGKATIKEVMRRLSDEEASLEMASLAGSDDEESGEWVVGGQDSSTAGRAGDGKVRQEGTASAMYMNPNSGLEVQPQEDLERVRSRSPHRSGGMEQIL